MSKSPIILEVYKCPLYLDTEFVRHIFEELDIGTITTLYTDIVTQQERTTKGNRLHDTKKTYHKNVYITLTNSTKRLDDLFSGNETHLIVNYSSDEYWDVYKCSEVPSFEPVIFALHHNL